MVCMAEQNYLFLNFEECLRVLLIQLKIRIFSHLIQIFLLKNRLFEEKYLSSRLK